MAHDIGRLVAQEFSAPPAQRHLFKAMPFVKFLQPPANPITKVADPAVENLYRQQLSRIHRLACGKYHSPNSPEIDAALIRWKQLWLEGLESPSFPLNLTPNHQVTGSNVVQDEVVSDNNLLIRTWTAYLSFIMQTNDFRG